MAKKRKGFEFMAQFDEDIVGLYPIDINFMDWSMLQVHLKSRRVVYLDSNGKIIDWAS